MILKIFNLLCSDFKLEEAKMGWDELKSFEAGNLDWTVGDISEIDQIMEYLVFTEQIKPFLGIKYSNNIVYQPSLYSKVLTG